MRYIITLTNVGRKESETLGFRASDLGLLKEKGFNTPLSFVVNDEAFDDFMAENGLRAKIEKIYHENEDSSKAFQEVMSAFIKASFPKELYSELCEAYESLGIEQGSSAHNLISGGDLPYITLIRSPSYILHTEDEEGILQNVKGQDQYLAALKLVWASAYSPASRHYRAKAAISDRFRMGVIVQKMKGTDASAVTYSRTDFNEYMIRVKSYIGFLDYGEPVLGKDVHDVDVNSLMIRSTQINLQEYAIRRDVDSDELVKHPLVADGERQKMNDKLISEAARLTKKAKSFIAKDLKLYLNIRQEAVSVNQVNRMTYETKTEVEEKDIITVETKEGDAREVKHEHTTTLRQTEDADAKLTMPAILSCDEARERVVNELGHKLFSLNGFAMESAASTLVESESISQIPVEEEGAERLPGDEESLEDEADEPEVEVICESAKEEDVEEEPRVEIVPAEGSPEAVEQEVEEEETLLEQVMKIKDITERMESHALNNHDEAYEQEARKLKELLSKVRSR